MVLVNCISRRTSSPKTFHKQNRNEKQFSIIDFIQQSMAYYTNSTETEGLSIIIRTEKWLLTFTIMQTRQRIVMASFFLQVNSGNMVLFGPNAFGARESSTITIADPRRGRSDQYDLNNRLGWSVFCQLSLNRKAFPPKLSLLVLCLRN